MDAVTISTTLATIVGLLCNYRQEKGDREQLDHRTFIEWLDYHRHEEIKNLICDTYHLQSEVDALLREDSRRLATKLNDIEEMLARLLSRVEGFAPVVISLHPGIELSEQALEPTKITCLLCKALSYKYLVKIIMGLKSYIRHSAVLVKMPSITSSDVSTYLRPD
jgi:predicted AAA+ superfamily ATPase